MRAVYLSDLHHAACALRDLPASARAEAADTAIMKAQYADHYRKALGKAHPMWGNGTLTSVFGAIEEPTRCDADYLKAMETVVTALLKERRA